MTPNIDKTWQRRAELAQFRNIERLAAYQLRKAGHVQPIIWRQK